MTYLKLIFPFNILFQYVPYNSNIFARFKFSFIVTSTSVTFLLSSFIIKVPTLSPFLIGSFRLFNFNSYLILPILFVFYVITE